ncbi:hypothetical protein ACE38W_10030 [Chitinophaga sp. Hz27]|uniref:hypothetical protein n=1 Tax=Chitinophaga sp. Hz27 TaxID=3347169 RepID=UPI0035D87491
MLVQILNWSNNRCLHIIVLVFSFQTLIAQSKVGCRHNIFIDAIGRGAYLKLDHDTAIVRESEAFYLKVLLFSCKGEMYFERYHKSNNKIVLSGYYADAIKLDTITGWAIDPITGKRSEQTDVQYKPLRTGVWKYYNNIGQLLKKEEYTQGKVMSSIGFE